MTKNPRGRQKGYSPIAEKPLVKNRKAWSMPKEDWEWLESQENQSKVLREAIELYRQNTPEGKHLQLDLLDQIDK